MSHQYTEDDVMDAVVLMNRLTDEGMEYPDALYRASQDTLVPYQALQQAYDAQFE